MDVEKRDSIAATLLAYYEFLVFFYLPDGVIRRPPDGGWPQITSETIHRGEKSDKVIDLLKHIPYIANDDSEYQIAEKCICNDYSTNSGCSDLPGEVLETCYFDQSDSHCISNIATIACAEGRDGFYIIYNVDDDTFWMCNFMSREQESYFGADELFGKLKSEFCSLVLHPLDVSDVWRDETGPEEDIKNAFQEHGWPTANYRKEEAMAEVKAVQDRWMESM